MSSPLATCVVIEGLEHTTRVGERAFDDYNCKQRVSSTAMSSEMDTSEEIKCRLWTFEYEGKHAPPMHKAVAAAVWNVFGNKTRGK